MADNYIWGNLNRAVNDPTLIDEAIAEAITAHNSDPDSHLQPGESLESHREMNIMDHPAESVVNDKLQFKTRAWTAIVDPSSEHDFLTVQSAVQYVNDLGGGSVFIRRGRHPIQGTVHVDGGTELHGEGAGETILYGSGAGSNVLNFSGGDYDGSWDVSSCVFNQGDDSGDDWNSGSTQYMTVTGDFLPFEMKDGDIFFIEGSDVARTVTYNSGYGYIRFTPAYTPEDMEWDIKTYRYIKFTNGSKNAQLIGYTGDVYGWDNDNLCIFNREGSIVAKIESFNVATNNFVLQELWTGATSTIQGFVGVGYGERNNIKALSFEGSTYQLYVSVDLTDSIRPLSAIFSECGFNGNNLEIAVVYDKDHRGYFDNCTFELTKTGLLHVMGNVVLTDCNFTWPRTSAQAVELRGECDLSRCFISNKGFASAGTISASTSALRMTNCKLELQKAATLGLTNSGQTFMANCSIEILSTGHLTVRGQQVVVVDSIIRAASTGRFVVSGSQCLLSAIGNITSHIFTTTGVLQKIENNLVRVW